MHREGQSHIDSGLTLIQIFFLAIIYYMWVILLPAKSDNSNNRGL